MGAAAISYRQIFTWKKEFALTLGGTLPEFDIAYETWGRLDAQKTNAILLFPGLSASAHAKSHGKEDVPGWWEAMIDSGRGLDSDRYFVICVNHLGGCFGSTGPSSNDPATGKPYGPTFPHLMLQDLVAAVKKVVEHLGISRLHCVIGASMGGMLALEYAAQFPDAAECMIMISASGRPGPQSISYRYVQRQVVLHDPYYADGYYYDKPEKPHRSMAVARQIGNITYRSREEFNERFGRSRTGRGYSFGPDFQVESYLHHMGNKLAGHFDANSFLYLTKAMDLYSLGYGFPTYEKGVARIKIPTQIIGVTTDMLFPSEEQEILFKILRRVGTPVRYNILDSVAGHDAFLVEVDYFRGVIESFLQRNQPF